MVTYGPFPGGWPTDPDRDFARIRAAGFNALRLYSWPSPTLLDRARAHGLAVFAGLEWPHARDFLRDDGLHAAHRALAAGLVAAADHPALAGVFVASEVPADLVRWMGPIRVRRALETLIAEGRAQQPDWLWAYANYPTTEFLEPENADFTAMNVYLEDESRFRAYVRRLHHIAGDRPLLLSEFGLDSRRNGPGRQAETLSWGIRACHDLGAAGIAVYAWSDRWWNQSREILDWDFGLIDRDDREKLALAAVRETFAALRESPAPLRPPVPVSIIVCTRNGRERIAACLDALAAQCGPRAELLVVDDGSTDGTADFLAARRPEVRLLRLEPGGLSAARNAGASAARGAWLVFTDDDCEPDPDWLGELAAHFDDGWDALGGPNLPPPPARALEAVIAAAPGGASHVMLDDREAEHLPGCNLAVTATAFHTIGGFDPNFHTAGDDVDFCWRLRDAGFRLGFVPTAFVWHRRRPTLGGYLRQQIGYGRAEALLMRKHPARFSPSGDARWHGTIYNGAPVRVSGSAIIYHGPMGMAGYQGVIARTQPRRSLAPRFARPWTRATLGLLDWLAPRLRAKARTGAFRGPIRIRREPDPTPATERAVRTSRSREAFLRELIARGWHPGGPSDDWDLERDGTKLLVAAEHGEDGPFRLLVRVRGDIAKIEIPGESRLEPIDPPPAER